MNAAREQARVVVLDEVARLEQQLADARARARELGAKPGKKPGAEPSAPPPVEKGRSRDNWEPGREPYATAARRYSPGVDYDPATVRAWAKAVGFAYPKNGRFLPGPLVQEWINHYPPDEG